MWTAAFWKGVAERMFWAGCAVIAGIVTSEGFNLATVDWGKLALAVVGGIIFSFVKSNAVNASGVGPEGSASLVYDRAEDDS